jgi:aminoglycoside phosphotransferase (APT) family kinase protein
MPPSPRSGSVDERDTEPVRTDERLDARALDAYLRTRLPGVAGALEIEQFPGGHSNLTYLLRWGDHEYVLRRPPLGPLVPKAHDMGREHRVLDALWPVFAPAPRPWLLCEDPGVIGAPFYVMERRRGVVVRRELPPSWAADERARRALGETVVDTMVDLHAVDFAAAGLGELGRPEGFMARQVRGWAERWERARDRDVPAIETLAAWLAARVPSPPPPTLVHGDLKLDNMMVAADDPRRVVAVLDWEMCTTGDPLADLGTLLGYWTSEGDPYARAEHGGYVSEQPGFPTRDELVARYAARSGRDVSRIAFYEVFARYKTAVVVQQIYIRWKRGQTRDPRFGQMAPRVEALAESALALAERSGL